MPPGTKIDVAKSEDKIFGVKYDSLDILDAVQTIDSTNKFWIAWAPRRFMPYGLLIPFCRELGLWIIPGKRKLDDS